MCQKFVVDAKTGEFELGRNGEPELRILNMGPEFLAPCRDPSRGCPKGSPESPNKLWSENEICLEHYREHKAIGKFPDDSVVRRNAAVIEEVERSVGGLREVEYQRSVLELLAKE